MASPVNRFDKTAGSSDQGAQSAHHGESGEPSGLFVATPTFGVPQDSQADQRGSDRVRARDLSTIARSDNDLRFHPMVRQLGFASSTPITT